MTMQGPGPNGNLFAEMQRLGFHELVSITPPHGRLAPDSRISVKALGKAPGLPDGNGYIQGYAWSKHDLTPAEIAAATAFHCGVGQRAGTEISGGDIDVTNPEWAHNIGVYTQGQLGQTLIRIGRAPKLLLPYRVRGEPHGSWKILFKAPGDPRIHQVEWLGLGKQFVVAGIHPATEQPYRLSWPSDYGHVDQLPALTWEDVQKFEIRLRAWLTERGATIIRSAGRKRAGPAPNQDGLKAPSLAHATRLIEALPNDGDRFSHYDDYVQVGLAIKGALQDHPAEARDLFLDWAGRWTGETDGSDILGNAEKHWETFLPPYHLGWRYLVDLATDCVTNPDADLPTTASLDFEPLPDEEDPATVPFQAPVVETVTGAFTKPGPRRWIYDRFYQLGAASLTAAAGGNAKTQLMMTECVAIATGHDLLDVGRERMFRDPLPVLYLNGEETLDELKRRFCAIAMQHQIEIPDRLRFVATGRLRLVNQARSDGPAAVDKRVMDWLIEQARSCGAKVIVIDPLVSFHGVAENDNGAMDVVTKTLMELARQLDVAVAIAHHTRKPMQGSTVSAVEDARGASALLAAVRIARTMNRMTEREAAAFGIDQTRRNYVRIDMGKNNSGPLADARWIQLRAIDLQNGADPWPSDHVGVVAPWTPPTIGGAPGTAEGQVDERQRTAAILARIAAGQYRVDVRSSDWAGHAVAAVTGLADPGQVRAYLDDLVSRRLLRLGEIQVGGRARASYIVNHNATSDPFV